MNTYKTENVNSISASSRKTLRILFLTLLLGLQTNTASAQTIDLGVADTLDFQWISGDPQWIGSNQSRLERSIWRFDTVDGSVVMFQPDGFPALIGSFEVNGNLVTLRGFWSNSTGLTGLSTAEFYGEIDLNAPDLVLRMAYVSGSTLAAVINDIEFGSTNAKAYVTSVKLGVNNNPE